MPLLASGGCWYPLAVTALFQSLPLSLRELLFCFSSKLPLLPFYKDVCDCTWSLPGETRIISRLSQDPEHNHTCKDLLGGCFAV